MGRLCARAGNRSTMTFLRRHAVCRVNTAAADAKSSLQGSTIRCTVVLQQKCDNATLIIFISTTTTNRLKNQQRHRVTSQQWLGYCPALQSIGLWLITASDRIGHYNTSACLLCTVCGGAFVSVVQVQPASTNIYRPLTLTLHTRYHTY